MTRLATTMTRVVGPQPLNRPGGPRVTLSHPLVRPDMPRSVAWVVGQGRSPKGAAFCQHILSHALCKLCEVRDMGTFALHQNIKHCLLPKQTTLCHMYVLNRQWQLSPSCCFSLSHTCIHTHTYTHTISTHTHTHTHTPAHTQYLHTHNIYTHMHTRTTVILPSCSEKKIHYLVQLNFSFCSNFFHSWDISTLQMSPKEEGRWDWGCGERDQQGSRKEAASCDDALRGGRSL